MLELGFTRRKSYHCVYFIGDHLIYFVLYVDDMLLIGNDKRIIHEHFTLHKDFYPNVRVMELEIKLFPY